MLAFASWIPNRLGILPLCVILLLFRRLAPDSSTSKTGLIRYRLGIDRADCSDQAELQRVVPKRLYFSPLHPTDYTAIRRADTNRLPMD